MRPQQITAENIDGKWEGELETYSFNEAAANYCGKHGALGLLRALQTASMRPQQITAENAVMPEDVTDLKPMLLQ